jgi:multisubunit Na+/H+ antiporter MnhB subunit
VTLSLAFDVLLMATIVAVAIETVAARDAFAAVVGFVAFGLLLAVAWVRIAAVDVALTEAAVGSLSGVLLLGAAVRLRATEASTAAERPSSALRGAAAALAALVSAALAAVVLSLPDPAPTLAPVAAIHLPATELGNPVTAVLMAYRAIDTLVEKVVVLVGLLAVWSLAPDRFWGGRPGRAIEPSRDAALAFLARLLPPIGTVVGVYLVWTSADDPGGAFQGSTVLAAMWILARMAGLVDAPAIGRPWLRNVLAAGPIAFLAVGLAGFVWAGGFLAYPHGWTKPVILAIEAAMTLSIAAMLAMMVEGPPARGVDERPSARERSAR